MIEDPAGPADVRFLHVFEAADGGVPAGSATSVESTSGTPFQGAALAWPGGSAVVVFPVDPAAAFEGTSYVAPAGVGLHLAAGLTPGAGYGVSVTPCSGGVSVHVAPGGDRPADAAGVLVIGP